MKTFCCLPAMPAILAALLAVSALQQNPNFGDKFQTTLSGKKVHDDFYTVIISDKPIPIEDALNKALTWNVEAQFEHFQLLQEHVKRNDKYASYCRDVIDAAQELLDVTLKKIGIETKVDICDYVKSLYDYEQDKVIPEEIENVILSINRYRDEVIKKLQEEQKQARAEAEAQANAEGQGKAQADADAQNNQQDNQNQPEPADQNQFESADENQPELADENQPELADENQPEPALENQSEQTDDAEVETEDESYKLESQSI